MVIRVVNILYRATLILYDLSLHSQPVFADGTLHAVVDLWRTRVLNIFHEKIN